MYRYVETMAVAAGYSTHSFLLAVGAVQSTNSAGRPTLASLWLGKHASTSKS